MVVADALGLGRARWSRVEQRSVWAGGAIVLIASFLFGLDRLGGLVTQAPRAMLRFVVAGVWGWLLIAAVAWIVARSRRAVLVLAVTGLAHVPVLVLAGGLLVTTGMLRSQVTSLVLAVFVAAFWFPASIAAGLRHGLGLTTVDTATATTVAYGIWLALVGRYLYDQLAHLV